MIAVTVVAVTCAVGCGARTADYSAFVTSSATSTETE